MTSNVIKQNSALTTRQCAEKWNTDVDVVAKWCREDVFPGAKHKGLGKRWFIPSDAKRPLDKVIACEILWQITECQIGRNKDIDLSCWGFSSAEDVDGCLQVLQKEGYIQLQGDFWQIKQLGMSLLGRTVSGGGKAPSFQTMKWLEIASACVGAAAGAFAKQFAS